MKRFVTFVLLLLCTPAVQAAVVTQDVSDWAESSNLVFGEGSHAFTTTWSTASVFGGNGWFYGSGSGSSGYADFYIHSGGVDVTSITDASVFAYQALPAQLFNEGDTIFLRNINGYYAALDVYEIYPNPAGEVFPYTFLNGRIFYQDDGSANFSVVPLPPALWLFGSGLLLLLRRRG